MNKTRIAIGFAMVMFLIQPAMAITVSENTRFQTTGTNATFIMGQNFTWSRIEVQSTLLMLDNNTISVRPSAGAANITVNELNLSKSAGEILANLTASAAGGTLNFTVYNLTSGDAYVVKKDGAYLITEWVNSSGAIVFNDSAGSGNIYTLEQDAVEPTIWNVSLNLTVALKNSGINISANVTDNINLSAVWANVTLPNSTLVTLTMDSSPNYSTLFTNTSSTGLYNVTVYANDSSRNLNSTNLSFIITNCIATSDCGSDGYVNQFCQSQDVYGAYRTYSCSSPGTVDASCSYSDNSQAIEDCGDSFCYYGPNYCLGNNVVNDTICYNRGCSPVTSACYSELGLNITETAEICSGEYVCLSGACVLSGTTSTTSTSTTTTATTTSTSTTTTVANITTSTTTITNTTTSSSTTTMITNTTSSTSTSTTTTISVECLRGDSDCDGEITDFELLDYIDRWSNGEVTDFNLLEAIDNWAE